jgi:hypothetical protein
MNCKLANVPILSKRLTAETALEVMEDDKYMSLCARCYLDAPLETLVVKMVQFTERHAIRALTHPELGA